MHGQLVDTLAKRAHVSNLVAGRCIASLADILFEQMAYGEPVQIDRIGWFMPVTWPKRRVYNFRTEAIMLADTAYSMKLRVSDRIRAKIT